MLRASALLILASAAPAAAEAFLSLPLDCTLGRDCYIEDYHDADPGPGQSDYRCGLKSRDGHRGTDFGLLSTAQMEAGVAVLAAAAGIVEAIRDGEPDIPLTADRRGAIAGRECGNAVRVGHENGTRTLYCHMKNGSVAVAAGDVVAAGDRLGAVGLSGETNYPHLHLSVLRGEARIDPFAPGGGPCGSGADTLWIDPPAYARAGLFTAGFSIVVPSFEAVKSGDARRATAAPDEALVLYGHAFHPEAGDVLEFSAQGPGGGTVFTSEVEIGKARAQLFRAVGRRAPEAGWPAGGYTGTVLHRRGETVIAVRHAAITVR